MRTAGAMTVRLIATGGERVNHIVGDGSLFSATVSDNKGKLFSQIQPFQTKVLRFDLVIPVSVIAASRLIGSIGLVRK